MNILDTVRKHCLAKPGAWEDHPWDENVWKIGNKIFCMGGETAITVKSTHDRQAALTMLPHIDIAKYVGRYGWVTVEIANEDMLEIATELIDESYELVAPKKLRK